MVVQDHLLLDPLQMVDREDQVVVVLGTYQVQVLLQLVEQEIHLLQLLLKVTQEELENIVDQLTLVLEVEVALENQDLLKEVVDQQVTEQVMEELE